MTTGERMASGRQTVEKAGEQARGAISTEAVSEQAAERTLGDSLRRMIDSVRPEAIFGAPVEREGVVIIPCSEVRTGFGMGGGSGFGPANTKAASQAEREAEAEAGPSGGGGMGGGGGAQGRPVAVIAVSQGQARVLPVVDVTKFMVVALTTAGFITVWLTQARARSREQRRVAPSAARFARAMRAARALRAIRERTV